ncbi:PIG-L family deacetylase [Akkermansiaceae bacterium]|nr:PIG-L family deacetylase [Akkermansiaceae bacterium]
MLNIKNKKILVVAPHVDDVELGMGATVHRLKDHNEIYYLGLSFPPNVDFGEFRREFDESCEILGIKAENIMLKDFCPRDMVNRRSEILQEFYDLNRNLKPDLVFLPNSKDIHQSHHCVFNEGKRAFKYTSMLGYELPWNSLEFSMDVFIEVTEEDVQRKVRSLESFITQKERRFFSNEIVKDLAHVRGKQIGRDYAECFEEIRLIL